MDVRIDAVAATVNNDASSSNHDDRLGSLEFSAFAATATLVENEEDRQSRGPRNARGRGSGQRVSGIVGAACCEIGRIYRVRVRGMQIITFDVEASDPIDNVKTQLERSMCLILMTALFEIVDVPMPKCWRKIWKLYKIIPQEHISERIAEEKS